MLKTIKKTLKTSKNIGFIKNIQLQNRVYNKFSDSSKGSLDFIYEDAKLLHNMDDVNNVDPLLFNSPILLQTTQKPVFPSNVYAMQVSKQYCQFINDNNIKYVGAFVLKDEFQEKNIYDFYQNDQNISNLTVQGQIRVEEGNHQQMGNNNNRAINQVINKQKQFQQQQQIQFENLGNKKNQQNEKLYLNIKGNLYKDKREQQETEDIMRDILKESYNFGSNVIYDDNLVPNYTYSEMYHYYRKGIQGITSLDQIYKYGTLCDIQFESGGEQGQKIVIALLRGIKKIKLIQESSAFVYLSKYKNIRKKIAKLDKTEEAKLNEEQKKLLIEEKNAEKKLINFVKCQPIRPPSKNIDSDRNYQKMMEEVLFTYNSLKKNFPINSPDLSKQMMGNNSLDILSGILTQSNYFSKQELMNLFSVELQHQRLNLCLKYFEKYEQELQKYKKKIDNQKKTPMNKQSLNKKTQYEQIYEYLKNYLESPSIKAQVQRFLKKVEGKTLPPKILEIFKEEIANLEEITEQHQEYDSTKQLLELITDMPWGVTTQDNFDLKKAKEILDNSHFGIDEVKQRVLEFIAVSSLKGEIKGRNLLLVGPPGTGKTSVASAIAKCLGRKYQRISVGGESDVAIIKGHRKTYVGSYPGKIVKALQLSQSENPVILIDEIEKTAQSHKGNIQEALLQILDPIQNDKFVDNFLEFEIDLSKVLFVCSANLLDTMHPALLDRLEVIELSGYTSQEKKQIFKQHIVKKAFEKTGLDTVQDRLDIQFTEGAIEKLMVEYAREPGMRNLERKVKEICEKIALRIATGKIELPEKVENKIVENDKKIDDQHKQITEEQNQEKLQKENDQNEEIQIQKAKFVISEDNLKDLVGLPVFPKKSLYPDILPPGVIRGLAYNSYGGSVIYIEATKSKFENNNKENKQNDNEKENNKDKDQQLDKGSIKYTGSLGDVMKESVEIAYSNVKYYMSQIQNNDFFEQNQIHIHFTEGATPKDGPSAGISIASSLISLGLNLEIQTPVAMTGELSATGKVLKIGGVREKILAAKREGIYTVILPKQNQPDFEELRDEIKEDVKPIFVSTLKEVIETLYPQLKN